MVRVIQFLELVHNEVNVLAAEALKLLKSRELHGLTTFPYHFLTYTSGKHLSLRDILVAVDFKDIIKESGGEADQRRALLKLTHCALFLCQLFACGISGR